jgi:hypothetical protein
MISLKAARSNEPSDSIIWSPNWLAIFDRAGLPGSTTAREPSSAFTMQIPRFLNSAATELFPVPIPPVSPQIKRLFSKNRVPVFFLI